MSVVFVPHDEIMGTPGLFQALASTPVTWTERLREMLSMKGIDTRDGSQVYDLRVYGDQYSPPGWLFCNAQSGKEAHDAFYSYLFNPSGPTGPRIGVGSRVSKPYFHIGQLSQARKRFGTVMTFGCQGMTAVVRWESGPTELREEPVSYLTLEEEDMTQ